MKNIRRFSYTAEKELSDRFERLIKRIGYPSRSEAIQDLMREFIIKEKWRAGNEMATGVMSIVYDHDARLLADKLIDIQHRRMANVVSSMHVHLDRRNCLEIIVLKGRAGKLKKIADEIRTLKSVKHANLLITGVGD